MAFFQDLGKRVGDAAKAVGKRTQEATEVVRLNTRAAAIQDEIERMFNQIGKAYYSMRDTAHNQAAETLCAKVDALSAELQALKQQLDQLKNLRRCPNCGEVQAAEAAFCAGCGTKMPKVEAPAQPESSIEAEPTPSDAPAPEVQIHWPKPQTEEAEQEPAPQGDEQPEEQA